MTTIATALSFRSYRSICASRIRVHLARVFETLVDFIIIALIDDKHP